MSWQRKVRKGRSVASLEEEGDVVFYTALSSLVFTSLPALAACDP